MRKNTKKMIIMVVSIVIILILTLVGLVLYFTTDFLKSDEQLFFKYLAQNFEVIEQYLEDPNKSEMSRIKSAPYTINSNISFDLVSSNSEIANQTTPPRNFNITYTKNADPQNNRDYSEANIKYLMKELFTAKYAHDGDIYAVNGTNQITSSDIFNVYLGIENRNLKQLAQKLGIQDVSNIPNRIENISLSDLLSLTNQEKEYIQDVLIKTVYSQVSKNQYYHDKNVMLEIDTKQVKANSYGITLTSGEYKNLIVSMLNAVAQDETMLDIILQKIMLVDSQTDITKNHIRAQIQNMITDINTNGFTEGIKIQVYESNGKIVRMYIEKSNTQYYTFDYERASNSIRTLISLNDTYTIGDNTQENAQTANSTSTQNEYQLIEGSAPEQTQETDPSKTTYVVKNIEFAKQISGMQNNVIGIITYQINGETIKVSLQNKTEPNTTKEGFANNIILNINNSDTTYFTVKINSNIVPNENITVKELNETNSAILNNRTPENISQLLAAIKVQLKKIYEQQMQVAKEVQEQTNANTGLNPIDTNVEEANTITNRTDIVGE